MSPVSATKQWVQDFVVRHALCPFAARPLLEERLRIIACEEIETEQIVRHFLSELLLLSEQDAAILETSLIVYPKAWEDFEDFLAFIDLCEELLLSAKADKLVQLAHFHPHYRFDQVADDAPSNRTNRSPYPVLQLIRVASVAEARASYPEIEQIPERNIALMQQLFA